MSDRSRILPPAGSQVIFGFIAAAITFGVGRLIGVAIA
jgi:hypothetical protein